MLAIIRTGGKQYRVQAGDVLDIERLEAEPGARVDFEQVLLIDDDKDTLIGRPCSSAPSSGRSPRPAQGPQDPRL